MLEAVRQYHAATTAKLAPLAPQIRLLSDYFAEATGQTAHGLEFSGPDAEAKRDKLFDFMTTLPPDLRKLILIGIADSAKRTGSLDYKGTGVQTYEAFGRNWNIVRNAKLNAEEFATEAHLERLRSGKPLFRSPDGRLFDSPRYLRAGPEAKLLSEDERDRLAIEAERRLARLGFEREVHYFADNRYDPITVHHTGVAGFLETALYGTASSAGFTGLAMLPGGAFLAMAASASEEYTKLRAEHPEIAPSDARLIAAVSGVIQGGMERVQGRWFLGTLPTVEKTMNELANPIITSGLKRTFIRGGITAVGENVVEGAQDLTTPILMNIANALQMDVPGVSAMDILMPWAGERADVAAGLSLMLIGSLFGIHSRERRMLNSPEQRQKLLELTGFSPEQISRIEQGGTVEEKLAKARKELANRNQKDISRGAKLYQAELDAANAKHFDPEQTKTLSPVLLMSKQQEDGVHPLAKPINERYKSEDEQRKDPARVLAGLVSASDETNAQQRWKPGRKIASASRLLAWAREHGSELDPNSLAIPENPSGGGEHIAFADPKTKRIIKLTKPGFFGAQAEDAGAYLQRMALGNRLLGDDVQFEGVVTLPGEHAPRAVISQSYIEGRDTTPDEQREYLRQKGYIERNGRFIHPIHGITIWDSFTSGNVIGRPDGTLQWKADDTKFARQVDSYLANPTKYMHEGGSLEIGETPEVLRRLGAHYLNLTIRARDLAKIQGSGYGKHSITTDQVKQLPAELREPLAVIESNTMPGSYVVLTSMTENGAPIIAAVHVNQREGRTFVNRVASVYGKNRLDFYKPELLRYLDTKKGLRWFQSAGLQLPLEGITSNLKKNVLTEAKIVNLPSRLRDTAERHSSPTKEGPAKRETALFENAETDINPTNLDTNSSEKKDVSGESSAGIFGHERKLAERLLQERPIKGSIGAGERSAYRARFNSAIDVTRDAAERLGGKLLFLPASDARLIFVGHDKRGEITLNVHPEAFDALMGTSFEQLGAFTRLTNDVLLEETLHLADLAALRDQWAALPTSQRGSFERYVEADRMAMFSDIRITREKVTGKSRDLIDSAILDAYRLYFEGRNGAPVLRDADSIINLLERGHDGETNHYTFVAEFTRMLAQAQRRNGVTETGFISLLGRLRQWVQRAIKRLNKAASDAESGLFGQQMQERLKKISESMNEIRLLSPQKFD